MTLSELEKRDASGSVFPAKFHTYMYTFVPSITSSHQIRHVTLEEGRVCKGAVTLPSQGGWAPALPQFLVILTNAPLPFGRICFVVLVVRKGGESS